MAKLPAANYTLQKLIRNSPRTAQEVKDVLKGLEASLHVVQQLMSWKSLGKKIPIDIKHKLDSFPIAKTILK